MNRLIDKLAVIFCILIVGVAGADQDDERLESLFDRLQRAADMSVIGRVEAKIWDIWLDSGREDINALMTEGVEAIIRGHRASFCRITCGTGLRWQGPKRRQRLRQTVRANPFAIRPELRSASPLP